MPGTFLSAVFILIIMGIVFKILDVTIGLRVCGLKKIRLEISVNDEFVKPAIEAVIAGAISGNIGDGKIFVLDPVECIRIRTGEMGAEAIG